jgi:glycosidase
MEGFRDPFCRAPYRKNEGELRQFYAELSRQRHESSALKTGDAAFLAANGDVLCILRFDERECFLTAVNRSDSAQTLHIAPTDFRGAGKTTLAALPKVPEITLPPMDGKTLRL